MISPFPRTDNGPGLGFLGKMVFQNWLVLYIGAMLWFIMVAVQVFEAADLGNMSQGTFSEIECRIV